MVFFTCSHCGESVKKPSVAKHYQTKCRKNEPFLTCVDCLKDFRGAEYEAHTKCVTEDERYSAKGYVPKPSQNKGERKQQAWQECIQAVLKKPTLKPDERDLVRAISKYENVPRKKSKFVNFLSNAFKHYANKTELIDRVWTEMELVFKDLSGPNEEQTQPGEKSQDSQNNSEKKLSQIEENGMKKEKKRKRQAEEEKAGETIESEKTDEKVKKKKQKSSKANSVESNSDTSVHETNSKQEKKNRKRKAVNDCQTEQPDSVPDEAEPGKKKKKKKHDKVPENPISETPEKESKKKGKNKKLKTENTEVAETPTAEINGNVTAKKEKKTKKTENKENCGEKGEVEEETDKPVSKKKSKGEDEGDDKKQETFDWKATILNVLNQDGKNKKIQLQKLQKKVLKLHCQILNCESSTKKEKKFMKKLKEMPQIEIDENFVVLKA